MLIDANLSPRLLKALDGLFPRSVHAFDCGGIHDDDHLIWAYAARHGLTIVTKDADFQSLSLVRGSPPKVIWLRVGNAGTTTIALLLRDYLADIHLFAADPRGALLILDG